jgi:hypothetical protein
MTGLLDHLSYHRNANLIFQMVSFIGLLYRTINKDLYAAEALAVITYLAPLVLIYHRMIESTPFNDICRCSQIYSHDNTGWLEHVVLLKRYGQNESLIGEWL